MVKQLIPAIYFYVLSTVGVVLLIIGVFNSIHFMSGIIVYEKYPLKYGNEARCDYMPKPFVEEGKREARDQKKECLESLEKERINTKRDDLEKSISFTLIGLVVFLIHFSYIRRKAI